MLIWVANKDVETLKKIFWETSISVGMPTESELADHLYQQMMEMMLADSLRPKDE